MFNIDSNTGIWNGKENLPHGVDPNLADGLVEFFRHEYKTIIRWDTLDSKIYILDVGCGNGYYTRRLNSYLEICCDGYDGNPFTPELTNYECKVADFSKDISYEDIPVYEWVLCLEVGEHIPAEFEDIFLDNICSRADYGIVLSWSIPEYGGDGHVNPRENDYIIKKVDERGFDFVPIETEELRKSASEYPNTGWWFKNTLMVFRRKGT